MLKSEQQKIEQLEEQVDLYQELLDLTKKENKLLKSKEQEGIVKIMKAKRKIRDEIDKIERKFNISKGDKVKLMSKSPSEKLKMIKPLVGQIYQLEKENQTLAKGK